MELSASFVLKATAVGAFQYFIIRTIYNLFFHPLKSYPGPRALAASQLPVIYANITGQAPLWALRFHKKYGPVVRMAPNELSYSDSSSWRDIYGSNQARPAGMARDPAFYEPWDDKNSAPSLVNTSDRDHARIRRVYAKAFSKQALSEQEPLIFEHITQLIGKIYKEHHQPIDIVDILAFTITDINIDLQFGEPLHLLNDTTHHMWVKNQSAYVRGAKVLEALAELPFIKTIFQLALPKLAKHAQAVHFGLLNAKLDHRLASRPDRPDFVHFLVGDNGPGAKLSEAELRANMPVIMIGQTETTTAALSGLIALLLEAPHFLRQLQEEVRSTFRTRSDINSAAMEKMKVLNACINETLRIYPPVPGALPRIVPRGGAMISGNWVPAGTRVYTSSLATCHSSENFHDPDSFLPQRWYPGSEERFAQDVQAALKPFSVGTKDCIGQPIAYYILRLITCELVLHFDLEPYTESKIWFSRQRIWTVWNKGPLLVKFTPVHVKRFGDNEGT